MVMSRARRDTPGRRRWLRLRALLAGGLVLGVGSAATLAAWNDSEHASGTLTTSTFGIEGSVNGGSFAEHATAATAAQMQFDPDLPGLSPGESGFLQFSVRTTADSTAGGTVSLQTPRISPAASVLTAVITYGVRIMPAGAGCDDALFSNDAAPVIVPNGTALSAAVGENSRELQPAAGNTVDYCARVSMLASAGNGVQGETMTATWQFLAESA